MLYVHVLRKYIAGNYILFLDISRDSQWSQCISEKRWGSLHVHIMLHVNIIVMYFVL